MNVSKCLHFREEELKTCWLSILPNGGCSPHVSVQMTVTVFISCSLGIPVNALWWCLITLLWCIFHFAQMLLHHIMWHGAAADPASGRNTAGFCFLHRHQTHALYVPLFGHYVTMVPIFWGNSSTICLCFVLFPLNTFKMKVVSAPHPRSFFSCYM